MGHLLVRLPDELHQQLKAVLALENQSLQGQVQSWAERKVRHAKQRGVLKDKLSP